MDVDNSDNVYVVGYVSGVLDGQSSAGGSDVVIQKYDSSGVKQWTRLRGSNSNDQGYGGTQYHCSCPVSSDKLLMAVLLLIALCCSVPLHHFFPKIGRVLFSL